MCGIAGFIDRASQLSKEVLISMTDALTHRGPDGSGYEIVQFKDAIIGLGHRRLSILDLTENGKQPMLKHGNWITFNGEIYNFKEIRKDLISHGYKFSSDSDTEVILSAYDKWGVECIHRFNGMFAFAILDSAESKIVLFRDRAGVKPLYIYKDQTKVAFASELKSFKKNKYFPKTISTSAIESYFRYGYVQTPLSIFNEIEKMKAGHIYTISLKNLSIEREQYWDIFNHSSIKNENQIDSEELESLLESSFNYRMVADVPVGIFLSGGYDSTLVATLLQKNRTQQLKTYTIGFEFSEFDESPYAEKVAAHLGTDHHTHICSKKEAQEIIPELSYYYDEPFADSSNIPSILVSRIAKESVTVALSADGGDEQFVGYSRYLNAIKLAKLLRYSTKSMRNFGLSALKPFVSDNLMYQLSKTTNISYPYEIPFAQNRAISDNELKSLLNWDSISPLSLPIGNNDINDICAVEYLTYMQDDILCKVDRATMSTSLEGREPFLDYRIAEYVMNVPTTHRYNNGVLKYHLKEIAHKYVPKEIMERPKQGFGVPINQWLEKDLNHFIKEFINKERIDKQNLFSWDFVQNKLSRFSFSLGTDVFVWRMLVFQMWYDQWIK